MACKQSTQVTKTSRSTPRLAGIAVTKLWELPLPPAEQPSLPNMQPGRSVGRSDAAPEPGLSETAGGENDEDGE
jgi:hypothetical protein